MKVTHVWLYTKNADRSISFYEKVLGLQVVSRFPHGALLQGGGILLGIHSEEGDRRSSPGSMLVVFQTDNIAKSFQDLKAKGVNFLTDHIVSEDFGDVADFRDLDGYLLEIWQPPRRSR
ncbi:MAG TPA: VOC family protein [Candidatus Bathyarchaeia archaeon]|nr:VOC family protein [Candidatus Bathyarchaeia archaeon]